LAEVIRSRRYVSSAIPALNGTSRSEGSSEIYHGYDGWPRIAEQFGDAWQELRMEIEEILDAGNKVVLFTNMVGLSKSG
jgi:hypothetical protein